MKVLDYVLGAVGVACYFSIVEMLHYVLTLTEVM